MPRDYAAKPLPCGPKWCPAALRMLWPDRAFGYDRIAEIYGCGPSVVPRRAEALGITDQRVLRLRSAYSAKRFRDVWNDFRLTRSEVAAHFGMNPQTCGKHAARMGLRPRPGGKLPPVFPPDFDTLWAAGVSSPDMARACKCHFTTVLKEVERRGLERHCHGYRAKTTVAQFRLAHAMARDAKTTQLAFEITGRQVITHHVELRRIAA